jgi:repressor LexA
MGAAADLDSVSQERTVTRAGDLIARLARRRAALGLSQARVATLMRTSQSAVARLESGHHDVQLSTVTRYAEALGLSLDLIEDTAPLVADGDTDLSPVVVDAPPGRVPVDQPPRADARSAAQPRRRVGDGIPDVVTLMPDRRDPDHVLTWRQRKILHVIADFVGRRGYAPSVREIGAAVGLKSTSSVFSQLSTLESKGYLRRHAGRARTMEPRLPGRPVARPEDEVDEATVMDIPSQEATNVPLVGRVAAGAPILAEESIDDIIPLPRQLVGEGSLFLLEVAGDSMTGAAITDGDWVVVRQQQEAVNGDIVAAMIDGETTVKTFRRTGPHVWLMPQNSAYVPILGDNASILGRVVAVLRKV